MYDNCRCCGKTYYKNRNAQKFCSIECRKEYSEKLKQRKKNKKSIKEVQKEATAHGMTYGQYVAMVERGMNVELEKRKQGRMGGGR